MTLEEKGAWLEMIFLMHESPERGMLLFPNGSKIDEQSLVLLLQTSSKRIKQIVSKLVSKGIATIDQNTGAICCRRMLKERNKILEINKLREIRATSGRAGGIKCQANRIAKIKLNKHSSYSSSTSSSTSINIKNGGNQPANKNIQIEQTKELIASTAAKLLIDLNNRPTAVDLKDLNVTFGEQTLDEPAKHKLHNSLIRIFEARGWDCGLIKSIMAECAWRLNESKPEGKIYPYYEKIIRKYINENAELIAAQNKSKKEAPF